MTELGLAQAALGWGLAGFVLLLLLFRPLLHLVRYLLRSSLWLAALALFRELRGPLGLALGVNPWNALVLGLLGVPGLGLLLLLQWALR